VGPSACNCRKSQCIKKYCDCYASGQSCSEKCKCLDCKNVEPENEGDEDEDKDDGEKNIDDTEPRAGPPAATRLDPDWKPYVRDQGEDYVYFGDRIPKVDKGKMTDEQLKARPIRQTVAVHGVPEKYFVCHLCPEQRSVEGGWYFKTFPELQNHIMREHDPTFAPLLDFVCNIGCCRQAYETRAELIAHVKLKHVDDAEPGKRKSSLETMTLEHVIQHVEALKSKRLRTFCAPLHFIVTYFVSSYRSSGTTAERSDHPATGGHQLSRRRWRSSRYQSVPEDRSLHHDGSQGAEE
jgi:hypothetical protein